MQLICDDWLRFYLLCFVTAASHIARPWTFTLFWWLDELKSLACVLSLRGNILWKLPFSTLLSKYILKRICIMSSNMLTSPNVTKTLIPIPEYLLLPLCNLWRRLCLLHIFHEPTLLSQKVAWGSWIKEITNFMTGNQACGYMLINFWSHPRSPLFPCPVSIGWLLSKSYFSWDHW